VTADPDFSPLTRKGRSFAGNGADDESKEFATRERQGCLFGLAVIVLFLLLILLITAVVSNERENWILAGWAAGVVGVFTVIAVVASRFTSRRSGRRMGRFVAFGLANHLDTSQDYSTAPWKGALFAPEGLTGETTYRARWTEAGIPIECATHYWYQGGGRSGGTAHKFGYVAFPCDPTTPRALFYSGVPMNFSWPPVGRPIGPDILHEEGRKPRTLTCRPGDAPRVREAFPDELLTLLSDRTAPFNAEIQDGWFFAYFPKGQELDPIRWRAVFRLAEWAGTSAR
jgi:hypothetical protein